MRQLQDRIESLEAKLQEKEKNQSPRSANGVVSPIEVPRNAESYVQPSYSAPVSGGLESHVIATDDLGSFVGQSTTTHETTNPLRNTNRETAYELNTNAASESTDGDTPNFGRADVLKKFSGRKSHLSMDYEGRTRYFGATSDHYSSFQSEPTPESIQSDSSVGMGSVLSAYSGFQDKLLDLCWQNPHPFLRIPDRAAFMRGCRVGIKSHDFSPFLLNCILLRSLHLTDDRLAQKLEPGLFERVKEQLAVEMELPDHNTVLGLLFLATYVSGLLKSGLGWLYSGSLTTRHGFQQN